jgi:hypothetical protein
MQDKTKNLKKMEAKKNEIYVQNKIVRKTTEITQRTTRSMAKELKGQSVKILEQKKLKLLTLKKKMMAYKTQLFL